MGKDTRATDAGSVGEAGLRTGGTAARRAAGDSREAGAAGGGELSFEVDEQQLNELGARIGAAVATPVVFALRGELGAGKSVLARAIAHGAGVDAHMPSPTFNLLFQYETARALINHLDLYRLRDPDEVWELGWQDLGGPGQIVLIEWPERAEDLLPDARWDVTLEPSPKGAHLRNVRFAPVGEPPALPL